ncbi:MAG TPA: cytochrome b/b6 domain-containing protein [Devosiaceae bacterium]
MANPQTYSKTQIGLHWAIALLVFFQILFHDGIKQVWLDRMKGVVANEPSFNLHALIGLAIGILVIWRLWLRFTRGVPALPEKEHPALRMLAALVHGLFYVFLLLMAASGITAWFFGLSQPALVHSIAEKAILALIAVHVAGALVQHFVYRSDVLRRMLGLG